MPNARPAALVVAALTLAAACSSGDAGVPERATVDLESIGGVELVSGLTPFTACDELFDHFTAYGAELVDPWGWRDGDDFAVAETALADTARDDAAGSGAIDGTAAYSTTNVASAGVDEPDLVKTDGRRLVVLTDGVLRVVDVGGAEPTL
ncbi:MAG TPA: hypothetical protein DEP66_07180, partial [Acidimicrobiaceae bacterium]|nr:hypothetical protein [Acidimicrobiaceae bacterium]